MKKAENTTYLDLPQEGKDIWQKLGNVTINENEEIDIPFMQFPIGTHRQEIWLWFEEKYNIIIGNIL
jgi:hypothetical protein